jgi:hypothetical protein
VNAVVLPPVTGGGMNALDHALRYAEIGWSVFPAQNKDRPLTKWGHGDGSTLRKQRATTDLDIVARWWARWPEAWVCIACGPSKIVVFDLDISAELDGIAEWRKLHGDPLEHPGPIVRTARGGLHLYCADPAGRHRNSASAVAPGVDVRGVGGMVVAPPSKDRKWLVSPW